MERLCIVSHLKNGHEYHLWTYGPLEVPEGVILEDGNEILPKSEIFTYSGPKEEGGGSVSAFSNLFRYKLLSERDGWWCDTDVVCLKPFRNECVIATEQLPRGAVLPTTCVMKVPKEVAQLCFGAVLTKDLNSVIWGEIGPKLFRQCVESYGLQYRASPETFCPIHWWKYESLFEPFELANESYAVHLWNEMWRRDGLDKDGIYRYDCLYENLKDRYLESNISQ